MKIITNLFGDMLLWQKFAILGGISVFLATIPFYLFFSNQQKIISNISLEHQAVQPLSDFINLLRGVEKYADIGADAMEKSADAKDDLKKQKLVVDQLIDRVDGTMGKAKFPSVQKKWDEFKVDWNHVIENQKNSDKTIGAGFEDFLPLSNEILGMVRMIMDESTITLDPDPVSYYLSQAVFMEIPELVDEIRKTRNFGGAALNRALIEHGGAIMNEDRFRVIESASQSLRLSKNVKYNLNKSMAGNALLKGKLKTKLENADKQVDDVLKLTQSELIMVNTPKYSSDGFRMQLSGNLESIFALNDAALKELDGIYGRQLGDARVNLFVTSAIISVIFALGFLTTFYITASISSQVGKLVDVVNRLAAGDNKVRAKMETLDEIGVLGRQFDIMVDQREAVSAAIQKENEIINNSVIELLQAVAKLSQKDLTIKAPVTEDVTGPVADALNLLTQETAKVLNRVVNVAEDVSNVSRQIKTQSDSIIGVASEEKRQVEQAANELSAASEVMIDIARLALNCNEAAEKAIKNTDKAEETVLSTVQGITTLRDTIRETEKRIKRLGERSQEISGVVNIINNIAERTHTLAINASMHAASAGEAGRGFAVVANEVQKLAENARNATGQISTLVNNIQVETAETVNTMNEAISQVVRGSSLALQAGNEMRETRDTTAHLVELVQLIADNSKVQSETTLRLRESAKQIQKGAEHTYEELQIQGQQTDRLLNFSDTLIQSVSVFTLPRNEALNA